MHPVARRAPSWTSPLTDDLDEDACYRKLVEHLHPDGLACPACGQRQHLGGHHRHRSPVLDYQCGDCGRVFNAWTGTVLQGMHRRPAQLMLILQGVAAVRMNSMIGKVLVVRPEAEQRRGPRFTHL
jgi:hypothetical protein